MEDAVNNHSVESNNSGGWRNEITDQRISHSTSVSFETCWGVGSTDFLKNSIAFTKVSILTQECSLRF